MLQKIIGRPRKGSPGSLPHGERLARVQASRNYVDGAFRNLVETPSNTQADAEVRARAVLPVHFGKFAMANHSWNDPIVRFTQASRNKPYVELTPVMGQPIPIVGSGALSKWW